MSNDTLDYAGYAFPVEGLGPGKRLAIWVRGCDRHCAGCIAPELARPGSPTPLTRVISDLQPLLSQADGLSISGGEPFAQAATLTTLLDQLRHIHDIEVLIYTGYRLEELREKDDASRALLQRIDLLIDGPFLDTAPNTLQWRGSDNQRVHLLSTRAGRYAGHTDLPMAEVRPLQVQMLDATNYRIIGIPRRGDLATYRVAMAARGLQVQQKL
jgi:anaerobic ribonucleoside-triphosphate reductase activating protein